MSKKFKVIGTQTFLRRGWITVEANDEESAEEAACEADDPLWTWELIDLENSEEFQVDSIESLQQPRKEASVSKELLIINKKPSIDIFDLQRRIIEKLPEESGIIAFDLGVMYGILSEAARIVWCDESELELIDHFRRLGLLKYYESVQHEVL